MLLTMGVVQSSGFRVEVLRFRVKGVACWTWTKSFSRWGAVGRECAKNRETEREERMSERESVCVREREREEQGCHPANQG